MITETTLEMHFHNALMELFRSTYGLGIGGNLNFYKYSPQKECFVGFDQAYGASDLDEEQFYQQLKTAAASVNYSIGDTFLGYFLQYKVVHVRHKRSRYTPAEIRNTPHYKANLDTTKNRRSGVSQHELLYKLSKNRGALVYYACPMIFDRTDLYENPVDLDRLKLVDMTSCPSAYLDSDHHSVYFDDADALPVWCSDPVEGRRVTPRTFVTEVSRQRILDADTTASARHLLGLLFEPDTLGITRKLSDEKSGRRPSILSLVAESLTIIRISGVNKTG